jgi:hypothetical protein
MERVRKNTKGLSHMDGRDRAAAETEKWDLHQRNLNGDATRLYLAWFLHTCADAISPSSLKWRCAMKKVTIRQCPV